MMVKESKEKRALTGNRMMNKSIPQYIFTQNNISPAPWATSMNGWNYNTSPVKLLKHLSYQTYFDLSGYSLSDLTTQTLSVILQEASEYISVPDVVSPRPEIEVLDLISTERPDPGSIVDDMADQNGPGFSLSDLSFDSVIWNQYRLYAKNTTIWTPTNGVMTEHMRNISGSGTPTAVDKLWITRIIFPQGVYDADPFTFMRFPASTFVLNASIYQEDDLPYLMRLKRSYELGTQ